MPVLFRLVLAAAAIVCVAGGAVAAGTGRTSGFEITVGAGWGHTDQSDINNKFIDEMAAPAGVLDEHLSRRVSFFGEVGYRLPPRHVLCVGLSYTGGKSAKDLTLLNIGYDEEPIGSMTLSTRLTASAFMPHARLKYLLVSGDWSPFLGLGLACAFGRAELEQEFVDDSTKSRLASASKEYEARGWGWFATMGLQHDLMRRVSCGLEGGYRRLVTSDLEDDAGKVWRFDGSTPAQAIRLDFSGWFVMGTLSVGL